jgi:hypothetical protein
MIKEVAVLLSLGMLGYFGKAQDSLIEIEDKGCLCPTEQVSIIVAITEHFAHIPQRVEQCRRVFVIAYLTCGKQQSLGFSLRIVDGVKFRVYRNVTCVDGRIL